MDPFSADAPSPVAGRVEFARFHDENYPRLVALLHAVRGDREHAQRVVQRAFTRAWMRWRSVRSSPDPAGWVRQAASRGRVPRRLRRASAGSASTSAEGGELEWVAASARPVYDALRRLDDEQRTVLALRHIAGMSEERIAEEWHRSRDAVASTLTEAAAALAVQLGQAPDQLAHWVAVQLTELGHALSYRTDRRAAEQVFRLAIWRRCGMAAAAATVLFGAAGGVWAVTTHHRPGATAWAFLPPPAGAAGPSSGGQPPVPPEQDHSVPPAGVPPPGVAAPGVAAPGAAGVPESGVSSDRAGVTGGMPLLGVPASGARSPDGVDRARLDSEVHAEHSHATPGPSGGSTRGTALGSASGGPASGGPAIGGSARSSALGGRALAGTHGAGGHHASSAQRRVPASSSRSGGNSAGTGQPSTGQPSIGQRDTDQSSAEGAGPEQSGGSSGFPGSRSGHSSDTDEGANSFDRANGQENGGGQGNGGQDGGGQDGGGQDGGGQDGGGQDGGQGHGGSGGGGSSASHTAGSAGSAHGRSGVGGSSSGSRTSTR